MRRRGCAGGLADGPGGVRDQAKQRERDEADQRRRESRRERWALRDRTREIMVSRRVQACGRPGARPDGSVVLRHAPAVGNTRASAGFGGLFACGSVWTCPECAVKIATRRAAELEAVLAHFVAAGGWACLVTLTMRHHRRDELAACLAAAAKGWGRVTSGRAWCEERESSGYAGYCRALEITESRAHGWHVHLHTVLVFHRRPSDDVLDAMSGAMFARWSAGLVAAGMPAPTLEHGLDVAKLDRSGPAQQTAEMVRAWARYVVKGIALEATMGSAKLAKGENRTIRQLLTDAVVPQTWECPGDGVLVETLDQTARARVHEYETAIKGRRQLTWSEGRHDLRAAAQLDPEQSDEAIAEEDVGGEDVAVIPRESWPQVVAHAADLLTATEIGGPVAGRRWLDERGITWWHPTRLTDHRRRGEYGGRPVVG